MGKQTVKNGKVEFMRFVFSVIIILFHCRRTFGSSAIWLLGQHVKILGRGYYGVEFFFLVTGYLTAKGIAKKKSVLKIQEKPDFDAGKDAWSFFWKKYMSVFPYHVFSFGVLWCLRIFTREIWRKGVGGVLEFAFASIPEFFFLQRFGFSYTNIDVVEWYISAMLIALMVLYPLAFRFYSVYTHIIGPFIGLWILGMMQYIAGTFSGQDAWTGFGYMCVFRAFAEMSLGMSLYILSDAIAAKDYSVGTKRIFTAVEVFGFVLAVIYALSSCTSRYEPQVMIFLAASIVLSFSGQTYGNELFQKDVMFWLGRISLPLYLCQLIGTAFVNKFVLTPPFGVKCVIAFSITVVMALLCQAFGDRIRKG